MPRTLFLHLKRPLGRIYLPTTIFSPEDKKTARMQTYPIPAVDYSFLHRIIRRVRCRR